MTSESTLICIHGYGVRGFFWENFAKSAKTHYKTVLYPNLQMGSLEQAITEIRELCIEQAKNSGNGVTLLGHSLGGILCALAAQELQPLQLQALVVLASPFGKREKELSPLLRFLLFRKLIPEFIIRRQFFGPGVSRMVQKTLFKQAVRENLQFQLLVSQGEWFHNDLIKPLPGIRALAIGSEADRIVPSSETAAMAAALGSAMVILPKNLGIGHDDYGVSPVAAELVLTAMLESQAPN